jgi:hypothetical protein
MITLWKGPAPKVSEALAEFDRFFDHRVQLSIWEMEDMLRDQGWPEADVDDWRQAYIVEMKDEKQRVLTEAERIMRRELHLMS